MKRRDKITNIQISSLICSTKERELLEELAILNNTTSSRSRIRPKPQPTMKITESQRDIDTEQAEESTDQYDLWKKLKDFAGSVANGALKWLKDNF